MKRAYAASQYAGPYERYCRENFPGEAEQIIQRAEAYYREFMKDTPDLGRNMMARNMLDWFTIFSPRASVFYNLDSTSRRCCMHMAADRWKLWYSAERVCASRYAASLFLLHTTSRLSVVSICMRIRSGSSSNRRLPIC